MVKFKLGLTFILIKHVFKICIRCVWASF